MIGCQNKEVEYKFNKVEKYVMDNGEEIIKKLEAHVEDVQAGRETVDTGIAYVQKEMNK